MRFAFKVWLISIMIVAISLGAVICFAEEVYEKDGCIYIIGNPTPEQRARDNQLYAHRRKRIREMYEAKMEARLKIILKRIEASALRDYLIANSIPLREVAEALNNSGIVNTNNNNTNVIVKDIISNLFTPTENNLTVDNKDTNTQR